MHSCSALFQPVYTIVAEVQSDFTLATVEGVASAALAALAAIDGREQVLDLATGQGWVTSVAAVNGSAVSVGARGVAVVDSIVRVAVEGAGADTAHTLVAPARAVAVVRVAESGTSDGGDGDHDEGD